jgi:hypothetical protein
MTEAHFYQGRFTLLVALMCIYALWSREVDWARPDHEEFAAAFIPENTSEMLMWGEGAVPQFLAYHWYRRSVDSGLAPDILLSSILRGVVDSNVGGSGRLPSPYYTFEDVLRHSMRAILPASVDPLTRETIVGRSFYAKGLLHLLVRTGLKAPCESVWPDFSKLQLARFEPAEPWGYCLWRTNRGKEIGEQSKMTKQWTELRDEARDVSAAGIPRDLVGRRFLFLLFVVLFPYRGTPAAIRRLGYQFNPCWFLEPPLEEAESR